LHCRAICLGARREETDDRIDAAPKEIPQPVELLHGQFVVVPAHLRRIEPHDQRPEALADLLAILGRKASRPDERIEGVAKLSMLQ
jgi:hypothetical protein